MCGIAGIINLSNSKVINGKNRVNNMLDKMNYRGPDGSGVWNNDKETVFIGNNRLAIVDPTNKFNGPLICKDKENILAYNGELYDYKLQKEKLSYKGIKFNTNLDTEILLEGYKTYGINFLNTIDGVWAFAFYNIKSEKLILCRDIMGEKHIFFYNNGSEFIFASEAKAIMAAINIKPEIDYQSAFSALRFFSTPPSKTILKNIKRLLPGHFLEFNLKRKGQINYKRFAKLDPMEWKDFFSKNPTEEKVIDNISELLDISVKNRLPSDVPFVSTLSGGIDSSLISYFASKNKKNIETLFIQTSPNLIEKKGELNEYDASEFTSKKLGTIHKRIFINNSNTEKMLIEASKSSIDGLLDWGSVSFQLLASEVFYRKYKVLLVSEGSDELCGGYNVDTKSFKAYQLSKRNSLISKQLNYLNKFKGVKKIFRKFDNIQKYLYEISDINNPLINKVNHECVDHEYLSEFFNQEIVDSTNSQYGNLDDIYTNISNFLDISQRRSLSYANKSIPDFSNLRTDRGIMAESVEPRAPFLNVKLVNFFLSMPLKYKFRNGYSKYILRKMVERYIGPEIAWRQKQGFSYPVWKSGKISKNLNINTSIIESKIIKELPWKNGGRELFLKNSNRKILWPLYCLSIINSHYRT